MSEWIDSIRRYPPHWRLLDLLDGAVERYVPRLLVHAVPLLMLLPALLLIGHCSLTWTMHRIGTRSADPGRRREAARPT